MWISSSVKFFRTRISSIYPEYSMLWIFKFSLSIQSNTMYPWISMSHLWISMEPNTPDWKIKASLYHLTVGRCLLRRSTQANTTDNWAAPKLCVCSTDGINIYISSTSLELWCVPAVDVAPGQLKRKFLGFQAVCCICMHMILTAAPTKVLHSNIA